MISEKKISTFTLLITLAQDSVLPEVGTETFVAGWGVGSSGLDELMVPIVNYTECNSPPAYNGRIDENSMICAGFMSGRQDACQGDSGGPLVYLKQDEAGVPRPTLLGIVSWGHGCAEINKVGVYTKISSLESWIVTAAETLFQREVYHFIDNFSHRVSLRSFFYRHFNMSDESFFFIDKLLHKERLHLTSILTNLR